MHELSKFEAMAIEGGCNLVGEMTILEGRASPAYLLAEYYHCPYQNSDWKTFATSQEILLLLFE